MPFVSQAQRRYFYANRGKLESQGVDVDEWERATGDRKLPERAKKKKPREKDALLRELNQLINPFGKNRTTSESGSLLHQASKAILGPIGHQPQDSLTKVSSVLDDVSSDTESLSQVGQTVSYLSARRKMHLLPPRMAKASQQAAPIWERLKQPFGKLPPLSELQPKQPPQKPQPPQSPIRSVLEDISYPDWVPNLTPGYAERGPGAAQPLPKQPLTEVVPRDASLEKYWPRLGPKLYGPGQQDRFQHYFGDYTLTKENAEKACSWLNVLETPPQGEKIAVSNYRPPVSPRENPGMEKISRRLADFFRQATKKLPKATKPRATPRVTTTTRALTPPTAPAPAPRVRTVPRTAPQPTPRPMTAQQLATQQAKQQQAQARAQGTQRAREVVGTVGRYMKDTVLPAAGRTAQQGAQAVGRGAQATGRVARQQARDVVGAPEGAGTVGSAVRFVTRTDAQPFWRGQTLGQRAKNIYNTVWKPRIPYLDRPMGQTAETSKRVLDKTRQFGAGVARKGPLAMLAATPFVGAGAGYYQGPRELAHVTLNATKPELWQNYKTLKRFDTTGMDPERLAGHKQDLAAAKAAYEEALGKITDRIRPNLPGHVGGAYFGDPSNPVNAAFQEYTNRTGMQALGHGLRGESRGVLEGTEPFHAMRKGWRITPGHWLLSGAQYGLGQLIGEESQEEILKDLIQKYGPQIIENPDLARQSPLYDVWQDMVGSQENIAQKVPEVLATAASGVAKDKSMRHKTTGMTDPGNTYTMDVPVSPAAKLGLTARDVLEPIAGKKRARQWGKKLMHTLKDPETYQRHIAPHVEGSASQLAQYIHDPVKAMEDHPEVVKSIQRAGHRLGQEDFDTELLEQYGRATLGMDPNYNLPLINRGDPETRAEVRKATRAIQDIGSGLAVDQARRHAAEAGTPQAQALATLAEQASAGLGEYQQATEHVGRRQTAGDYWRGRLHGEWADRGEGMKLYKDPNRAQRIMAAAKDRLASPETQAALESLGLGDVKSTADTIGQQLVAGQKAYDKERADVLKRPGYGWQPVEGMTVEDYDHMPILERIGRNLSVNRTDNQVIQYVKPERERTTAARVIGQRLRSPEVREMATGLAVEHGAPAALNLAASKSGLPVKDIQQALTAAKNADIDAVPLRVKLYAGAKGIEGLKALGMNHWDAMRIMASLPAKTQKAKPAIELAKRLGIFASR